MSVSLSKVHDSILCLYIIGIIGVQTKLVSSGGSAKSWSTFKLTYITGRTHFFVVEGQSFRLFPGRRGAPSSLWGDEDFSTVYIEAQGITGCLSRWSGEFVYVSQFCDLTVKVAI